MSATVYVYLDNNVISDVCMPRNTSEGSRALVAYLLRSRKYLPAVSAYGIAESENGKRADKVECRGSWYDLVSASGVCFAASPEVDQLGEALWKNLGWDEGADSKEPKRQHHAQRLRVDALHAACAALNGAAFLVTWDKHLVGSPMVDVMMFLRDRGIQSPQFQTPDTFMGMAKNPPRRYRERACVREADECKQRLAEGRTFKQMCAWIRKNYG